jgi:hypothetical protein
VEQDVPSLSKLRKCASNVYSVDIIRKMELAVLIELDWELSVVCSAHFLEAVLALTNGGTFPHDDIGDRQWTSACCAQLRKLCGFLHSICLQDGHIGTRHGSSPSRLAAAIVATARLQLGIYPVWPAELRAATGYNCDTLGPAMSSIMKLYKDSLPPSGTERAARDVDDARASHGASDGTYFETKANGSDVERRFRLARKRRDRYHGGCLRERGRRFTGTPGCVPRKVRRERVPPGVPHAVSDWAAGRVAVFR